MQVDSLPAEPQWKPKNTGVASMGLIPSWGTKILHAMWPKKKKKKLVCVPFFNRNKISCCFYDVKLSGHSLIKREF